MTPPSRALTPQARDAARVLGQQIAQARRHRGWTARDLAERVGVSVRTVANLEQGSPSVAVGTVFEAATVLGVRLFGADGAELARLLRQGQDTLALLPSRVRRTAPPVDDDF